jgi:hypothetical protein
MLTLSAPAGSELTNFDFRQQTLATRLFWPTYQTVQEPNYPLEHLEALVHDLMGPSMTILDGGICLRRLGLLDSEDRLVFSSYRLELIITMLSVLFPTFLREKRPLCVS